MSEAKVKPFWKSTTIRRSLGAIAAFIAIAYPLIQPDLEALADGASTQEWIALGGKIALLLGGVSGSAGAIAGRVSADSRVFTPPGLPGPNEEDLLEALFRAADGADDAAQTWGEVE